MSGKESSQEKSSRDKAHHDFRATDKGIGFFFFHPGLVEKVCHNSYVMTPCDARRNCIYCQEHLNTFSPDVELILKKNVIVQPLFEN